MNQNKLDIKTIEEYVKQTGRKVRVLWLSDTPTCATGFAQVAKNILRVLNQTGLFEFDVVGINYDGTPHDLPYKIHPALNALKMQNQGYNDLYGRQELLDMLGSGQYDLFFTLQDTFIIEPMVKAIGETSKQMPVENKFKTMFYFPIDAVPKESWIKECVSKFDYPIAYTNYAYEECIKKDKELANRLKVIYHGTNIDDFKPITELDGQTVKQIRDKFFLKENRDKFIFMNLNRNQPRKDMVRTMKAFSILHKERPDTFLYLHCQAIDAGGNLFELDKQFCLRIAKDWSCPNPQHFQANQGYPIAMINALYNSVDCVVSTTLGEGWGLCLEPKSLVKTRKGYKEIQNININDFVLTHRGYKEVLDKKSRHFKGDLIEITANKRSKNDTLKLTPEHKILTFNGWTEAKKLKIGDLIADVRDEFDKYQRQKFDLAEYCNTLDYCRSEKHIWCHGSYKKNFKRFVNLNKDFAELYGIYLAEGSASKNGIVFSISQDEKEFTNRIIELVKKVWGLECYIENDKNSKKRWIRVYGNILKIFYKEISGRGARNKDIKIFDRLTQHTAAKVLKGFWTGDGSKERYGYEMTTCSRKLAYNLSALGDRLNMKWSVEYNPKRDSYRLRTGKDYAYHFSLILGNTAFQKFGFIQKDNVVTWLKVKNISKYKYDGDVYDIMVNDCHQFMTNHCIVHNSNTEAFATKTPLIVPNNTSAPEICGEQGERGLKVKSGSDDNLWSPILSGDNERMRPIVDVYDMVEKMKWVMDNPEKVKEMTERAYTWAIERRWESELIGGKWIELFKTAALQNLTDRGVIGTQKIGRNEPCPCGATKKNGKPKKYKQCCAK